jgi:hypothetical protein
MPRALGLRALAVAAFVLALAACDGAGPPATPTAAPTAPPPSASPTVIAPAGTPIAADAEIDLATAQTTAVIYGADEGDLRNDLPPLVSGDFNGDGIADILLGARFGDGPGNDREDAGEAYVVLGSPDLEPEIDLAAGDQSLTVWGEAPQDNLGFAALAADLNADGLDDIVLGAPFAGPTKTGAVYVVFGADALGDSLDLAADQAAATLLGPGGNSFFGDSLAAGDVNGDGAADLIVGATFAGSPQAGGQPGATYVFFGRTDWPSRLDAATGGYDVAVFGADNLDELGDTVAAGDVNGDGIDDIIMTAEAADGPANQRGVAAEVHIVYGSPSLTGDLFISRDDQDVSVLGADANDTLGFSLSAGDVTGDGIDDVIMGARGDNGAMNAQNRVGALYLLPGAADLPATIDLAASPPPLPAIYGHDTADTLAYSAVADVDGDGQAELLAAAILGDGPDGVRTDAGEVYVLRAETLAALEGPVGIGGLAIALIVYGGLADGHLGSAMTAADVNADGRPELLLLAAEADGPDGREAVGRAYIVPLP